MARILFWDEPDKGARILLWREPEDEPEEETEDEPVVAAEMPK
jgi:hypothetical protein